MPWNLPLTSCARAGFVDVEKSFLAAGVYILVTGVICSLSLSVWSCGMVCKCCGPCHRCCAEPFACSQEGVPRFTCSVMLVILTLVTVACTAAGLANETTQHAELGQWIDSFDLTLDWAESTSDACSAIDQSYVDYIRVTWDLKSADYKNDTVKSAVSAPAIAILEYLQQSERQFERIHKHTDQAYGDYEDNVHKVTHELRDANNGRSYFMYGLYTVVMLTVLTQLVVALLRTNVPAQCGGGCCGCCQKCLAPWQIFLMSFLFFLAVTFSVMVIICADVCYDADVNIATQLSFYTGDAKVKEMGDYYIFCDTCNDEVATSCFSTQSGIDGYKVNVFNEDITTLMGAIDVAVSYKTNLTASLDAMSKSTSDPNVAGDIALASEILNRLTLMDFRDEIAGSESAMGFSNGELSRLHCLQVNSRYQAAVNQGCTASYEPFTLSFEYVLALAVFMFLIDVVRRLIRPSDERQSQDGHYKRHDLEPNPDRGHTIQNSEFDTAYAANESTAQQNVRDQEWNNAKTIGVDGYPTNDFEV